METWEKIDADHYRARFYSGTYDARRSNGEWTLWFQPTFTRGFLKKPGSWPHLAQAKHRAKVLDNDHFLARATNND